jgi:hypothetical protein
MKSIVIKLMYKPVSIIAGMISGRLARRSFALVWRAVDDRQPPQPAQRSAGLGRLAVALALQGAVFSLAKGLIENLSRRGFAGFVGRWPGDDDTKTG